MCSTDVYCSKQTGSSTKETITHHFFVSGIGQKKACQLLTKICGGAENVVKRNPANVKANGLLGFVTLGIYTPLEARV